MATTKKAKAKSKKRVLHVPAKVLKAARAEAERVTQRFVTKDIVWVPMERKQVEGFMLVASSADSSESDELFNLLEAAFAVTPGEQDDDRLLLAQLKARVARTDHHEDRQLYFGLNTALGALQEHVDLYNVGC